MWCKVHGGYTRQRALGYASDVVDTSTSEREAPVNQWRSVPISQTGRPTFHEYCLGSERERAISRILCRDAWTIRRFDNAGVAHQDDAVEDRSGSGSNDGPIERTMVLRELAPQANHCIAQPASPRKYRVAWHKRGMNVQMWVVGAATTGPIYNH